MVALFLESKNDRLDYREALMDNERAKAIVNVLWDMLCLPFNFLDCSFTYWVKRIYYFIYGNSLPKFLKKEQDQKGIVPEFIEYD